MMKWLNSSQPGNPTVNPSKGGCGERGGACFLPVTLLGPQSNRGRDEVAGQFCCLPDPRNGKGKQDMGEWAGGIPLSKRGAPAATKVKSRLREG